MTTPPEAIRLNRYLAQCGLGSRRACDDLISAGKVTVNGTVTRELGIRVVPGQDQILFDGKLQAPGHQYEYVAFYKPTGLQVTKDDPFAATTIYDFLRTAGRDCSHLNYAGRLDTDSEGLLILTNDGDCIYGLTHPRFQIKKVYQVTLSHELTPEHTNLMLTHGVASRDQFLHASEITRVTGSSTFQYEVVLFEGKNRQIRRMFGELGYTVEQLLRVQFGGIKLNTMKPGELRTLSEKEITSLKASRHPQN